MPAKASGAHLETLSIYIKARHLAKIAAKRRGALALGVLLAGREDFVPAIVLDRGRTVLAKVRLKGDWVADHLTGAKWSFRMEIKGGNTVFGMKRFSLHRPAARSHLFEWMFHRLLRQEGLIGLRYFFVRVRLNERDLGVYALEEHFERRLLEHQGRREGPIVRFDESLVWEARARSGKKASDPEAFRFSAVDTFDTNRWLSDAPRRKLHASAISLLEGFRQGTLQAYQVFDVERTARYMALCDLLGASHGLAWINQRYYCNPITLRLEPIGFDACLSKRIVAVMGVTGSRFVGTRGQGSGPPVGPLSLFFRDARLFEAYVGHLERISRPAYLDRVFSGWRDEAERLYATLLGEETGPDWPLLPPSALLARFRANQETIRSSLRPVEGLHVHIRGVGKEGILARVGCSQQLPVEVLRARVAGRAYRPAGGRRVLVPGADCAETAERLDVRFVPVEVSPGAGLPAGDVVVTYRLLGAKAIRQATVPLPVREGQSHSKGR